jgi:hypothetical protein
MRRWIRVFKAFRILVRTVDAADEDNKWTREERNAVLKAIWGVVRAYRGKG